LKPGKKLSLGLAGSALLVVATFSPIVSIPIIGPLTFFSVNSIAGLSLIWLSLVGGLLTFASLWRYLALAGLICLSLPTYIIIRYENAMDQATSELRKDLNDPTLQGIGQVGLHLIQLEWGVALMILGALCWIAAGVTPTLEDADEFN
jgi:hypothetical protein